MANRPWTAEELEHLRAACSGRFARDIDWEAVARQVGRSPCACQRHARLANLYFINSQANYGPRFITFLRWRNADGWSDEDVARAWGGHRRAVGRHRRRLGLHSNAHNSRHRAKTAATQFKPGELRGTAARRYCGDCLEQLAKLPDACVDLIYIDPPFNSNRNYEVFWGETKEKRAFEDRHASTQAYIDYMRPRCVELARVLKKTGSFYYHCDWHASHYVKVMLDQIFGDNEFQSEIIWKRTSSHGNVGRSFGNITDSIFYYTASRDYTWNQVFVEYSEEHIRKKFTGVDPDGRRYTTSDLRNPGLRPNLHYDYTASNGVTYEPHPNGWAVSRKVMEQYDREGRLYFPLRPGGRLRLKRYLDETQGERVQNLWDDISPVNSRAEERLGYPTQKPLALLERIIKASSNPNDIVLDAFCGCGTALVAAQNLGRQWIGIDISPTACRVMAKRLRDVCKIREDETLWRSGRGFIVRDLPWSEAKLRQIPPTRSPISRPGFVARCNHDTRR